MKGGGREAEGRSPLCVSRGWGGGWRGALLEGEDQSHGSSAGEGEGGIRGEKAARETGIDRV